MAFNDPALLLDCPFCDGTYWPGDTHCSFCKNQVVSDAEINRMNEMERSIERSDKIRYDL